ncbi:protein MCM10 homolog [Chanos chanos]|uniref:Protein MCM10 homolog n=1 Tax=Chanos chanos TaxID=29144 RepID=A0A6J2VT26_CHACN|nr:protein MCM10 homolog [Chanos chanos]
MTEEDNLDLLLSLFAESQAQDSETPATEDGGDDLDDLFDDNGDDGCYVEPEEVENEPTDAPHSRENENDLKQSKEAMEVEMKTMQEKMRKLQQELEALQKNASSSPPTQTAVKVSKQTNNKVSPLIQRGANSSPPKQCSTKPSTPLKQGTEPVLKKQKRMVSPPLQFSTTALSNPQKNSSPTTQRSQRIAHQSKAGSSENSSLLAQPVSDSSSQSVRGNGKVNNTLRSPPPRSTAGVRQATPRPAPSQDIAVEKFSGLRLKRPRLSSIEIEHKMAGRRMLRLSQLPERLNRDKLEDSDWVTFGVVINKITPQSKNNGKTFSIWKLNDLHNLEVNVSLFLFGSVHMDLWKTDTGTVIGILNPNPMKNKEGSNELCLTVDHPQKVLILGEAMDFGTCKARKKNGDACTQLVNLFECQYCQYHVKAQYKKMSSKRAELQSSFSGSAPGKGKGRGSLRERLCQTDFHYGGMSSLACAPSQAAPQSKKLNQPSIKSVLAAIPTPKLALQDNDVSGCSDDFKSLLSMPTPGALNIKRHLGQARSAGPGVSSVQSISASQLLKQQKDQHQQRMEARKRRAEEIQKRVLQNSRGAAVPARPTVNGASLLSPKAALEVPDTCSTSSAHHSTPPVPALGRGLREGEDILFDLSPPSSQTASKLAAIRRLQAKGGVIVKDDPNSVKRKRPNSADISVRVERGLTSPEGEQAAGEVEEPAQKKKREQQEYVQSEEFQRILNAKSKFSWMMGEMEEKAMQDYFDPLVQKEKLEEKMKSIREMKCRAVTCKTCKYTHFKPADRCVEEKHDYHWHDAVKRFFKCPCGQRKISLARLPQAACSNCGLFKWERDGMLKEKNGPKIGGELLLPRGEEQPKFLNSLK